ncbi:MAG: hypothetical protein C3F13_16625 [Anaerolineales bacterium]|nr:DUF3786 domain-containing protein [Anaerolineae bacterium]PWB50576.1 MAG: hypothetical protein C3F13_16625 [Anaerolineales bacterium]
MTGLTDQAGGMKVTGGEAIEKAHQAWQESMLKQLDVLRSEILATQPGRLAANCAGTLKDQQILLRYWGQEVSISLPDLRAHKLADGTECSVYDSGVLLYYLREADGTPMADHWIGYRELPGGSFYSQAFQGYSGDRLARVFGENADGYTQAARAIGGTALTGLPGLAFSFLPLPRVRLAAILYPGDEEFAARGSVLFDAAASHYMTTDGLALLGAGLVGRLVRVGEA